MRDLYHNVLVSQPFSPANSTVVRTSSAIDLQGFNSAVVIVSLGTAADTLSASVYWTMKLQHSDDNSTYADVASADVTNGATSYVADAPNEAAQAYVFGYIGGKRYLKAVATPTGTHTSGTPIGMIALRSTASQQPVA